MNFLDKLKNFFREDFGEIIGIHHDSEKIFLARLTDKLETTEQNFEIDFTENISPAEQLAEKFLSCAVNAAGIVKKLRCVFQKVKV